MYQGLEAVLHDAFWAGDDSELGLLENFLQLHSGTSLELGCGSGRLMFPLIEKGFFIEGLDNSEEMLNLFRAQAGDISPVLHHADMADFQTGATYGAIAIPAFSLQLVPYEIIPNVLGNIRRHLHPGGGLYITTFIPWAELTGELEEGEEFLDHETYFPDGRQAKCFTTFQIQRLSQQLTRVHRYELYDSNEKLLEETQSEQHLTWFWPRELEKLLNEAGFQIERRIGDFDVAEPACENSHVITVIAKLCEGE